MTEVGTGEALNLDELKALCAAATEGPWDHRGWYRGGVDESYAVWQGEPEASPPVCKTQRVKQGWDDANFIAASRSAVPALVAEVERLRAQRDEALRILTRDGPDADFYVENCRQAVRVLSRTEDGIQPRSYYDVVRSMTADPDVLAAVDKAEAEDGTNG